MTGWSFQVCSVCGKHGRPISPEGGYGLEMASKENAMAWVDGMPENVKVTDEDTAHLLSMIHLSRLVELESEVEPLLEFTIGLWNDLNNDTDFVGDPTKLHETVEGIRA
jgi:hypothetical protein